MRLRSIIEDFGPTDVNTSFDSTGSFDDSGYPGMDDSGIPPDFDYSKITPDTFFKKLGAIGFMYTEDGHLLYDDNENASHNVIIYRNRDVLGLDISNVNNVQDAIIQYRQKVAPNHHLLGRCGYVGNEQVATFWNDAKVPRLINPCLDALEREGIIIDSTIVVLSNGSKFQASSRSESVTQQPSGTAVDPVSAKKMRERELMQQLHLMPPQQKKAAMKELGLVGGGHKQPWQKATEKHKLIKPGQKWWAMQSESEQ